MSLTSRLKRMEAKATQHKQEAVDAQMQTYLDDMRTWTQAELFAVIADLEKDIADEERIWPDVPRARPHQCRQVTRTAKRSAHTGFYTAARR